MIFSRVTPDDRASMGYLATTATAVAATRPSFADYSSVPADCKAAAGTYNLQFNLDGCGGTVAVSCYQFF